jgi:hypothetical protein
LQALKLLKTGDEMGYSLRERGGGGRGGGYGRKKKG